MAGMNLSPAPVTITDDVGDTQSILVSVTEDGAPVDLTAWTVTGEILDKRGGAQVETYTVNTGATRTLTLSAAETTALGAGTRWYAIRAVDPLGAVQTLAHGPHVLHED